MTIYEWAWGLFGAARRGIPVSDAVMAIAVRSLELATYEAHARRGRDG